MLRRLAEIESIKESDVKTTLDKVFEESFGNPIEFSAAPALAELEANTWGFFGNDLYIKTSSGSGIKVSGAAFT